MRQYERGDRVCVDLARARPLPQTETDRPTEPILSGEERQREGWLSGMVESGTADGLFLITLEAEAVRVVAEPAALRPRGEGDGCT